MFHATARALHNAAAAREDGREATVGHQIFGAEIVDVIAPVVGSAPSEHEAAIGIADGALAEESLVSWDAYVAHLSHLSNEFRWAESKLMQASERLVEAQEAGRKDLVALACMRRELRADFAAEQSWLELQLKVLSDAITVLSLRADELTGLVESGVRTASLLDELAIVRADLALRILAERQVHAQIARIEDSSSTLEYEVANEAYSLEVTGETMRELARLKSERTRSRRAAVAARNAARDAVAELGIASRRGEVTALASFLAAAWEGDDRSRARVEAVRADQISHERAALPEAERAWKTGLRHPVNLLRARKLSSQ